MRLQISRIETSVEEGAQAALARASERVFKLAGTAPGGLGLSKSSVDARRGRVKFVSTVAFSLEDSAARMLLAKGLPEISAAPAPRPLILPHGDKRLFHRPVVVGLGPAGLFAALMLAREGYRPLVLERGAPVDERVAAVEGYWKGGILDPENNVQFGEGGAGTFSDGKLTTRIHDPLCAEVLRILAAHGAPPDILVKAKPHVGTDLLRGVVKSIREEILRLGGEVRFHARVDEFIARGGRLRGIRVNGEELPADAVILAVGHSARDTFAALDRQNRLEVVARTFDFTAGQEKEHAEIFYQFLAPMNGSNILMDAGFPVNTEQNVPAQLRAAVHNETEECNTAYPEFSRIAREEGVSKSAVRDSVYCGLESMKKYLRKNF